MSVPLHEQVLSFFRLFPENAEISEFPDRGTAEITLRGPLATRFAQQGVPSPHAADERILKLLLGSSFGSVATGYESVSPSSHLVRTIQNYLEEEGSQFCRTAAVLSLSGDFTDLRQLKVEIRHAAPQASIRCHYQRYFLVSYLFSQSSFENFEETMRVVIEWDERSRTARVVAPARAKHISEMVWADVTEFDDAARRPDLPPPDRQLVEQVLSCAERAAADRARRVAPRRVQDILRRKDEETKQIQVYYDARLRQAEKSVFKRQQTESEQLSRLQHLNDVFHIELELSLLSVRELLVPLVEYSLSVEPAGVLPHTFAYDPLANRLTSQACPRCGQEPATQEWSYCGQGHHLECYRCQTVHLCCEPDCHVSACHIHAEECHVCDAFVCHSHRQACPSCGEGHCRGCQGSVRFHDEPVCLLCRGNCRDCSHDLFYRRDDLKYCVTCSAERHPLCVDHRDDCSCCGDPVCKSHQLTTEDGLGCDGCYAACNSCGSRVVQRTRLASCPFCPTGDLGLHCSDRGHAAPCQYCLRPLCPTHRLRLHDDKLGCSDCSSQCSQCHHYFGKQLLEPCVECHQPVCESDRVVSEFRPETYCRVHGDLRFDSCPGCGRSGPRSQLQGCGSCGLNYCPHCHPGDASHGECAHCISLRRAAPTPETFVASWKSSLAQADRRGLAPALWDEMQKAFDAELGDFEWSQVETHRHRLLRASARGGIWKKLTRLFRQVRHFLLVIDKQTETVQVRVNHE